MIRAALVAVALACPATAATQTDCNALLNRIDFSAEKVDVVAQICLFSGVTFGMPPARWYADRISLSGDIDALPDALPTRLSGGVTGLVVSPGIDGQPALEWLMREQAAPGLNVTFDAMSAAGVVTVNSFVVRMADAGEVSLTARLAGVPEIWPVDPVAVSAVQLQALDAVIEFNGLFEALALMPLGTAVMDMTAPATPQIAALRSDATAWLGAFADGAQAENAEAAEAFLDALPHPRGVLEIGIGGTGLSAVQLLPLMTGGVTQAFVSRVADAAELDIFWLPEAP